MVCDSVFLPQVSNIQARTVVLDAPLLDFRVDPTVVFPFLQL